MPTSLFPGPVEGEFTAHYLTLASIGDEPGKLVSKSAGLVIERLRVRIPAGAAREFSSPELTFFGADSYSVFVPPPCYRSGT